MNIESDEFRAKVTAVMPGTLTTVTKVVECGMQYDGPAYNLQFLTLSCGHQIYYRGHAELGKNIPCVSCLTC